VAKLTAENVRAYLARDWAAARAVKDARVGRWVRSHGTTAAFRMAQVLLDRVWSQTRTDTRRRRDVSGLVELTRKLARARTKRR